MKSYRSFSLLSRPLLREIRGQNIHQEKEPRDNHRESCEFSPPRFLNIGSTASNHDDEYEVDLENCESKGELSDEI